jgi:hypothetical protein
MWRSQFLRGDHCLKKIISTYSLCRNTSSIHPRLQKRRFCDTEMCGLINMKYRQCSQVSGTTFGTDFWLSKISLFNLNIYLVINACWLLPAAIKISFRYTIFCGIQRRLFESGFWSRSVHEGRECWCMSVTPATWVVEVGKLQYKALLGKSMRLYLKIN